jgi:uncharacterized damage-inducible protein DinB
MEAFLMPIAEPISTAASSFKQNDELLSKCFDGLSEEEWLRQPGEQSNHVLWIAGHIVWARAAVVRMLGAEWTKPWLSLFGRGAKLGDAAQYPQPDEMKAALAESAGALKAAMEAATAETLAAPGPERVPSIDGTLGGTVFFLAFHETGHVGQVMYLRTWLGKSGVMG